jgi:hypothetical protein
MSGRTLFASDQSCQHDGAKGEQQCFGTDGRKPYADHARWDIGWDLLWGHKILLINPSCSKLLQPLD